ncbi:hypothetical protein ACLOJK_034165 [Asimina triloba]
MYRKIYKGDFKCPPWFSPESRRIMTKLLDPNPNTRITTAKLIETSWFKKSLSRSLRTTEEEAAEGGLRGRRWRTQMRSTSFPCREASIYRRYSRTSLEYN